MDDFCRGERLYKDVSESSTSSQKIRLDFVMTFWKNDSYFGDASPKNCGCVAQIELRCLFMMKMIATEESHMMVSSLKEKMPLYIHPRSSPTRLLTLFFMENLEFCDKHNMVAFLEKSTGSAGFHQVIDFLNRNHICYALTKKPAVSVSFIKQFWRFAAASTNDNGEVKIIATIDGHSMTITEASLR
ncbi:hypothetical protein Tco_0911472 [Tanacetum coccineum]|uniref:Uncharacterized protein n=1 Tax=Tanacetum coccineum TaxID=301880 RepID=A0ABQ5CXC0_9ASTR